MKLSSSSQMTPRCRPVDCRALPALRRRRRESGIVAVIVMLTLLGILLVFVAINLRVLSNLDKELKLTERHQLRRLQNPVTTNAAPAAVTTHAPPSDAPGPATTPSTIVP